MKNILQWMIEEVAIEGETGCAVHHLPKLLANRCNLENQSITIDEPFMNILWNCLLRSKSKQITIHDRNGKQLFPKSVDSLPYQKALTEKFKLLASENFRYTVILGKASAGRALMTDQQYHALCGIARARQDGIVQPELTKYLNEDPRSMFNVVKVLCELNLAQKQMVLWNAESQSRSLRTSLFKHWRYADTTEKKSKADSKPADNQKDSQSGAQDKAESDVDIDLTSNSHFAVISNEKLRVEVSQQLAKSKNRALILSDLTTHFVNKYDSITVKSIRELIRNMTAAGYLKRAQTTVNEDGKSIKKAYVELIKEYVPPIAEKQEAHNDASNNHEKPATFSGLVRGLPVDYQILKAINDAGTTGATTLEMARELFNFNMKISERRFDKLLRSKCDNYSVNRIAEVKGKQRENRYTLKSRTNLFGNYECGKASSLELHKRTDSPFLPPENELQLLSNRKDTILAATRRKGVLEILEEEKILEIGIKLARKYRDRFQEVSKDSTLMDRRTIRRLAETLASNKQAHMIDATITRYTGFTDVKTLLIHPSLDKNGPEVKKFVEGLQHNEITIPSFQHIDGLDLDRLGTSNDKDTTGKSTSTHWQVLAGEFGFLPAKMLRARHFHVFLFDLLRLQNELVTDSADKWCFDASMISHQLSLQVYLKIIGHTSPAVKLREFLAKGGDKMLPLSHLPVELRKEIRTSSHKRLRQTLISLFKLYCVLGIVQHVPVGSDDELLNFNLSAKCPMRLITEIDIRDLRLSEKTVVATYTINERVDIEKYWFAVQTYSTMGKKSIEASPDNTSEYEAILYQIRNPRNWSRGFTLNPALREILEREVDKENLKTPYEDTKRCLELAEITGLSLTSVRAFYKRVLDRRSMQPPKLRGRKSETPRVTLRLETITSANGDQLRSATILKRRNPIQLLDSPILRDSKRTRQIWDMEEDFQLVAAYVIVHSRMVRFNMAVTVSWPTVAQSFSDKPSEICRRRWLQLREKPEWKSRIALYLFQWPKLYEQLTGDGKLEEEICTSVIRFDLMKEIEVFKKHSDEMLHSSLEVDDLITSSASRKKMPQNKNDDSQNQLNPDDIDDILYSKHRFDSLCNQPMLRVFEEESKPTEKSLESIQIEKTAAFVKMLLMISNDEYDPTFAHSLITQFTHVDEALIELKNRKTIVESKINRRRIPGRGFELSQRALACLKTKWPENIFSESSAFHQKLTIGTDLAFCTPSSTVTDGAQVLSLISMAFANSIDLSPEDISIGEQDVSDRTNPNISMKVVVRIPNAAQDSNLNSRKRSLTVDGLNPESAPNDHNLTQNRPRNHESHSYDVESIETMLRVAGPCGLSSHELQQYDPHLISDLLKAGRMARVGYTEYRYVAVEYCNIWYMKFDVASPAIRNNVPPPDPRISDETDRSTKRTKQNIVETPSAAKSLLGRSWFNLKGHFQDQIFQKFVDIVLMAIVTHPGIPLSRLSQRLSPLMDFCEMEDVLDFLISRNSVKKIIASGPVDCYRAEPFCYLQSRVPPDFNPS